VARRRGQTGMSNHPPAEGERNSRLPDGKMSQNSPYTASLIETLDGNHKNLPTAFPDLSQRVVDKTNGAQIPCPARSMLRPPGRLSTSWSGLG
jgi:hypothetical protein